MELRLAPSGKPLVGNEIGDLLVWKGPVDGWEVEQPTAVQSFRYAQFIGVQGTTAMSDTELVPVNDSGDEPVLVPLANPDPTKRYRATAQFCYRRNQTDATTLEVRLQASYDGGSTWETWQASGVEDPLNTPITTTLQFALTMGWTLGSDLGMPVDATSVILRLVVRASATGAYIVENTTPPNLVAIELTELTE